MHEGHRARLRDKIRQGAALCGHERIEALLFNALPRVNVNRQAHNLVERFQTPAGVLLAPVEELKSVQGVGESAADYLYIIGRCLSIGRYAISFGVVNSTEQFKEFLLGRTEDSGGELEIFILDKLGNVKRICALNPSKDAGCSSEEALALLLCTYRAEKVFARLKREGCGIVPGEEQDGLSVRLSNACRASGATFHDLCLTDGRDIYSYFVNDRGAFSPSYGVADGPTDIKE